MCLYDPCIIITTNWEVHLHIWMVARVGLMHLQHFVHQHLGHNLRENVVLEDIPVASLPPPVVDAPVATVPSPAPESCPPSPGVSLLTEVPLTDLFPNLFTTPACTFAVDRHPH